MALRLTDELVPAPEDGDPEIQKLKWLLETGAPLAQQSAAAKLVYLRAEQALTDSLSSKNPVAVRLATDGLWECWLNEQGPSARRQMNKGIQRMNDGDLGEALEIFAKLAAKYPRWAEAHNKQATVLYLLGNARLSFQVCQLVVELKPNHFGAWNGMALCAARLDKWQAALDAATKALSIQPSAPANRDLIQLAQAKLAGQA